MAESHLVLLGYGVADSLQFTIEAQRAIGRATTVYGIAPPPTLVTYLKGLRIKMVDLAPRVAAGAEGTLDVADFLLRRAVLEPPIAVTLVPGVSILDTVISDLGLDVTTRGLQIFEARALLGLRHQPNPCVPLLALQAGALTVGFPQAEPAAVHQAFYDHLAAFYPADHAVTLITETTGRGSFARQTVRLNQLPQLLPHATTESVLFLVVVPKG